MSSSAEALIRSLWFPRHLFPLLFPNKGLQVSETPLSKQSYVLYWGLQAERAEPNPNILPHLLWSALHHIRIRSHCFHPGGQI